MIKPVLGSIFEHDCGMDSRSWDIRVEHDFGPEAVEPFRKNVEALTMIMQGIQQTSEPKQNMDLLFHQLFPDLFPDPMK